MYSKLRRIFAILLMGLLWVTTIGCEEPADEDPPVISSKSVTGLIAATNSTAAAATINWKTDEPASSAVYLTHPENDSLNLYAFVEGYTKDHSVLFLSLESNTQYHYEIRSNDEAGNSSIDDSDENVFTTL